MVVKCCRISPEVPFSLETPYNYPVSNHGHSFVTRNGQKQLKNKFLRFFTSATSYSTHNFIL
jgi:hypothetical protein